MHKKINNAPFIHVHHVCILMVYVCIFLMFLAWHIFLYFQTNVYIFIYVYKSLRFDNKMILRIRGALPPGVAFHVADVSVVRLVAASPGLLFGCDRQERGHLELQGNQRMRRYIFIFPIIEYHIIYVKRRLLNERKWWTFNEEMPIAWTSIRKSYHPCKVYFPTFGWCWW